MLTNKSLNSNVCDDKYITANRNEEKSFYFSLSFYLIFHTDNRTYTVDDDAMIQNVSNSVKSFFAHKYTRNALHLTYYKRQNPVCYGYK